MLIELSPQHRHDAEAALPPIWSGSTLNPARIDWYTRLVIESGLVKGGASVIPELIAAMIGESALNNRAFGDSNPDIYFGVGWMQLDSRYHVRTLDNLHLIRLDPLHSLTYACDPVNGLAKHGGRATWFATNLWNGWSQPIIDPTTGWSPLGAALDAWARVN